MAEDDNAEMDDSFFPDDLPVEMLPEKPSLRGLATLKHGMSSPALAPLMGCRVCPWKGSCPQYEPASKAGCAARRQYLVESRKEIGNVSFNLMQRALVLREEVEAEAAKIRLSGESPLQNRAWLKAYEVDVELAKFLLRMKYGTRQTITVQKDEGDYVDVVQKTVVPQETEVKG